MEEIKTTSYSGPTTTAHSAADGRMKVDVLQKKKKKLLKSKLKEFRNK